LMRYWLTIQWARIAARASLAKHIGTLALHAWRKEVRSTDVALLGVRRAQREGVTLVPMTQLVGRMVQRIKDAREPKPDMPSRRARKRAKGKAPKQDA
jgi:hypothetical protein